MTTYLDNEVLVCGGHIRPNLISERCFAYSKETGSWKDVEKIPVKLKNSAKVTLGSSAYLLGGWTESGPTDLNLVYDSPTMTWFQGTSLSSARTNPCAVTYKGNIIITGGQAVSQGSRDSSMRTVEYWNPTLTAWVKLPELNNKRHSHGCAVHKMDGKNVLVVVGGKGESGLNTEQTVEYMDLDTNQPWTSLSPLVKPRCCWPQVGSIGGELMVLSGETRPSNSIETFSSEAKNWIESPVKLQVRRYQSSATMVPQDYLNCP